MGNKNVLGCEGTDAEIARVPAAAAADALVAVADAVLDSDAVIVIDGGDLEVVGGHVCPRLHLSSRHCRGITPQAGRPAPRGEYQQEG